MKRFLILWLFAFVPIQILQGDTIRKDYCIMSGEAERKAENEISQKFGLRAMGSGGGAITVIRNVGLDFETDNPISIAEGRRLLIACSEILLKNLNGYRPLRPFLFEYPFPMDRISIAIFVSHEGTKKLPKNAPTIFSLSGSELEYDRPADNYDKPASLDAIHSETYQEALQIIASEKKNQPSNEPIEKEIIYDDEAISPVSKFIKKGEATSTIPRYIGPNEEREMSWHLDDYGNALAKKYDMEFHRADSFSDDREETYSLMFINFQNYNLDQGKKFATTLVRDFLRELKTSPEVKRYHAYMNNSYKRMKYPPLISEEPVPEQMGLKITFWDKNFDRPKKPYLAEIVFLHGDFYYYEANQEIQARELVLKQSYAEAIRDTASSSP